MKIIIIFAGLYGFVLEVYVCTIARDSAKSGRIAFSGSG